MLGEDIQAIELAGACELHFDVMDGAFVPSLGLSPHTLKSVKSIGALPCEAHLMTAKPERFIQQFVDVGCETITLHVESCTHIHRALSQIRDAGASVGLAINPATPLTKLEYLLPLVDRILLLATEPGDDAASIDASTFERVKILHDNIEYEERQVRLLVEGHIGPKDAALFLRQGADQLVLDHMSIFSGNAGIEECTAEFVREVENQLHLV